MGTYKINADLDVLGEVQGTSLDINGNGDISGTLLTSGNVRLAADLQVGDTTALNSYGALQVNQTSDVDEEGIAVLNSGGSRSIRIYCDGSDNAVINSGNGGNQTLKLNEGSGNVIVGGDITCGDDLFMPSGGVINFNSGDITLTHSSNKLTLAGGALELDGSGHIIGDGATFIDDSSNELFLFDSGDITIGGSTLTISAATVVVPQDIVHAGDVNNKITFGTDTQTFTTSGTAALTINSSQTATFSGVVDITGTTDATDATGDTGILRCEGGASIAKKLYVGGAVTSSNDVIAFSDRKLKDNIKTLDGKKVLDMRGVSFTRKDTGSKSSGVIAQEIQEVAPELVHDTNGTLGVAYGNLVGYLIEAIKDQQKQIDELKEMCNGCSR